MDSAISYIQALLDEGKTPTQIRVNDPWKTAILQSGLFSGESPAVGDGSIVVDAQAGEAHLIVFVGDVEYFAVLSR